MCAGVPLDISAFSVRPPHRERVTSGRSLAESERHSVPLSAAALPTDCGDCEPECIPESIQCLVAASDSLEQQKRTKCHSTDHQVFYTTSSFPFLIRAGQAVTFIRCLFHNLTSSENSVQQHQAQVHSGHLGRYPQDPDAGSSLGHLHAVTE